ncbi:MAG: aminotransferase class V-fold PLP-dependent enzyme [Gemmatimonadales bacterium]|jgi:selenocysteine lyase/cysteine desulfurase
MKRLQDYFEPFRRQIIGVDQEFESPYGRQRLVYADWTASGRLYAPIEDRLSRGLGPFVANTHTETIVTGTRMTHAYRRAHALIKRHVNAGAEDVILTPGFGMTSAINKFQRILGLRVPEQLAPFVSLPDRYRPVIFVTHMEHHSNHTSWLETIADVVCIEPDEIGLVDPNSLRGLLEEHGDRKLKIGAFTACSNVTGVRPPVHELAKVMHEHGGLCFVDYAASAPYAKIDMRPPDPLEKLDAILFSPHKFLGGPGSSGVLIFDSNLYRRQVPDQPGGGTVDWTNPWGGRKYIQDIEEREDGGTPGFLQAIKAALCIQLKEEMGVEKMAAREEELLRMAFDGLRRIPRLRIMADHLEDRQSIVSFYVDGIHYNLIVKLLNDRFGVQTRGGCVCAGTYGHYLLHVDPVQSKRITDKIDGGDLSEKPGWVRVSLHPTTTDEELEYIIDAIAKIVRSHGEWGRDYTYSSAKNEYQPITGEPWGADELEAWFELG